MELLTREGCHLCAVVEETVAEVCCERGTGWVVIDLDRQGDPDLLARWTDLVPVVLVDGIEVAHWELDPRILRRALGRRRRLWPL
ncbi:glutaredoxin family protein [Janibacter massiliensis]|uniref:glutaredoxin family protein n=1 Tax=Janibacter massiliensis TaxID=2058291 RepID=UPI001F1E6CD8|nr:glutaredoxin family protein [Janibacter massiliensis]